MGRAGEREGAPWVGGSRLNRRLAPADLSDQRGLPGPLSSSIAGLFMYMTNILERLGRGHLWGRLNRLLAATDLSDQQQAL